MKMISEEVLSGLIRKSLSRGGDYADVFIEHTEPLLIQLEDDKVEKLYSGVDAGIGFRVISGNRSAYAYGNDFSLDALYSMAESVSMAFKEGEGDITINLSRIRPSTDFVIKLNPRDVDINNKLLLVEAAHRI